MSPRRDSEAARSFQARLHIPLFIYVIVAILYTHGAVLFSLRLDACAEQLLFCGSTREREEEISEKEYGEIPCEPALPHSAF